MDQTASADVLSRERRFFDDEASGLTDDDLQTPTETELERYRNPALTFRYFAKDALIAALGPWAGKQVLDYGCGHGENACILAACGASITAFDLSPGSIETARKRARVHRLEDRIRFDVREAGRTGYAGGMFDVVTGFAILHHLHRSLPEVFEEIHRLLKPGGVAAFIEPVANSPLLQRFRRLVPVPLDATPDERQLTYQDFAPLHQLFASVEMRHFDCFRRLDRVIGARTVRPLSRLDYWAQRVVPPIKRYYGRLLVIAHKHA